MLLFVAGLKSVVEVKLERNPQRASSQPKAAGRGSHQPENDAEFVCPVTGALFNGRCRWVGCEGLSSKSMEEDWAGHL